MVSSSPQPPQLPPVPLVSLTRSWIKIYNPVFLFLPAFSPPFLLFFRLEHFHVWNFTEKFSLQNRKVGGLFWPPPWCTHPVVLCLDIPTHFQMPGLSWSQADFTAPRCPLIISFVVFVCLGGDWDIICRTAWKIFCQTPETQKFCLENYRDMHLNNHRNQSVWPCGWLRRTPRYVPEQNAFPISDFFFWDSILFYYLDWSWTHHSPPASASWVISHTPLCLKAYSSLTAEMDLPNDLPVCRYKRNCTHLEQSFEW